MGNHRAASLMVERTFKDLGITIPSDETLLVRVVPLYPAPESKDRLRVALTSIMQQAQLAEMPEFELQEITTYGDLVRKVSGGIPPNAYLCPKGEVYFVNLKTCPKHFLPLTLV
jgi:hypothetical protein